MAAALTTPLLDAMLITDAPTSAAYFAKLTNSIIEVVSKSRRWSDNMASDGWVHSAHIRTLFKYKGNKKPLVTH